MEKREWLNHLKNYIKSFKFEKELEISLIQTYIDDSRQWNSAWLRGIRPEDAFDDEISHWIVKSEKTPIG